MMAKLKFIAPLFMAGAAATAIVAAPVAAADAYAVAAGISSITIPASPGGDGCDWASGVCGGGDASGGGGSMTDGTWGHGDASGGGGCTAEGVCGSGGPWGGGGCVPGVGCFNWGQ
jgi:hypothetical protein